jgi:hypothetical protein
MAIDPPETIDAALACEPQRSEGWAGPTILFRDAKPKAVENSRSRPLRLRRSRRKPAYG